MRFLFLISCTLYLLPSNAQPRSWGAFVQTIDATAFRGKKFKIEAAVKVQPMDSAAGGEIWVRIDRVNKKMGFFYNMMDKPIRLNQWKMYSIEGVVDKDAVYLNFGGLYNLKGLFYFDDFKLWVEDGKKMKEIAIGEAGFEGDTAQIGHHWPFLRQQAGFVVKPTGTFSNSGKQSLMADGSGFIGEKTFGDNDTAGHYVMANGIRVYYETYGEGPPLLLLHGNSESIASFKEQIPALSKRFKVIAMDSRGQGKTTENGKKFTYDLFAEDANALLNELHVDSVNILGWSDGGNTGLIMAIRYPSKVKKLAVMGANLYNDNSSVKPFVNKELNKQLKELSANSVDSVFRKRMIDLLLNEPHINPGELMTITCPVLVMAGSDDLIKEEHTKLIARSISKSQLVIFLRGNHYEPWERPVRFNETVLRFFLVNVN